jgi:hypothetical protein
LFFKELDILQLSCFLRLSTHPLDRKKIKNAN